MADRGDRNQHVEADVDTRYQWVLDLGSGQTVSPVKEALAKGRAERPESAQSDSAASRLLAKVPLFRELPGKQLREFFKLCTPITVAQGENVCTIDAPSEELFVLLSGELSVLMRDGLRVSIVQPVTTVGEMGFVTKKPRTATLLATKPCSLLSIKNTHLQTMLKSDPVMHLKVFRNIIEILSARIVSVNAFMKDHMLTRDSQGQRIEELEQRLQIAVRLLADESGMSLDDAAGRIDGELADE